MKGNNGRVTMPETQDQHEPLDAKWLADTVTRALNEDLGGDPGQDVTTQAIIDPEASVTGELVAREAGVIAGIPVLSEVLPQVANASWTRHTLGGVLLKDGDRVNPGDVIAEIAGPGHVILMAERTILNFMSHASGIATHTRSVGRRARGHGDARYSTRARPSRPSVSSRSTRSVAGAA